MRIKKIELYNIGPYEGVNEFAISNQSTQGKIVLVGGKNGAGKTTLFNSIKLGLYGYRESGYQAANSFYKAKIRKLVNDRAKIENNPKAYVRLDFEIMNGQGWDFYSICRTWALNSDHFETLVISKENEIMSETEINDFNSYLLNLIPPELFELYFFDGEEIAEFFLNKQNNRKLKEAFLTLCGYDTFDIIYKYLKKIAKANQNPGDDVTKKFLDVEAVYRENERKLSECDSDILEKEAEIDEINAALLELEKTYSEAGGLSIDEWKTLFSEMKNEEVIREEKNAWLKQAANEMIPFLILKNEMENLKRQIEVERNIETQSSIETAVNELLPTVLQSDTIRNVLPEDSVQLILKAMREELKKNALVGNIILNLSKQEQAILSGKIENSLSINENEIINARQIVRESINSTKKMRDKISVSSIDGYESFFDQKDSYLQKKTVLLESKSKLLIARNEYEKQTVKLKSEYSRAEKEWEKALKSESIGSLTGKAIKYFDKLQRNLYEIEKKKAEEFFMYKINQLMTKNHFIDKIEIGTEFDIHVYKRIVIECKHVCEKILSMGFDEYEKEYGYIHCEDILRVSRCQTLEEFVSRYKSSDKVYDVMLEFDKSIMSKGEKQIFIMSLYWAIMQLCNKDIPFIIDTPFARIDKEHRKHIAKHFFKELNGQIFIFSTDEEITSEHIAVFGEDLQAKFLIENKNNEKTTIKNNVYFGDEQ